jgi:hypothetical protein
LCVYAVPSFALAPLYPHPARQHLPEDRIYFPTRVSAKSLFRLALLLFLLAAFFGFEIINLMVSLKYETDGPNGCISHLTQVNLCKWIAYCKVLSIGCLATGIFFLVWSAKRENPV